MCIRDRTVTAFSEESAHLAYAAGDILLMPSLFEPCGLSQLIAFAYGTIPVARATGGLADTVIDADSSPDGTGFLFTDYSIAELEEALNRALAAKDEPERWSRIVRNAMKEDFSWNSSATEYAALYRNCLLYTSIFSRISRSFHGHITRFSMCSCGIPDPSTIFTGSIFAPIVSTGRV